MSQTYMPRFSIIDLVISPGHSRLTIAMQRNGWHWLWPQLIFKTKFLHHSASLLAAPSAINYVSMVECDMHVCFFEAQEIAPLPRVKIHPDVDLLLLALVIQLASE